MNFETLSYHFDLPEHLIAQTPLEPRDQSRLMILDRKSKTVRHDTFKNIEKYLAYGDCLIANNSKVMRARLVGNRVSKNAQPGGKVEILLLEPLDEAFTQWEVLVKASGVLNDKFEVAFEKNLRAQVLSHPYSAAGTTSVKFSQNPLDLEIGEIPLPPYITSRESRTDQYQTVFAKPLGSAAAPTAGLHFTPQLIEALIAKGCSWREITLHVGVGTFRPVKSKDLRDHEMHEERFMIPKELLDEIKNQSFSRIIAVGTTSARALESAFSDPTQILMSGRSNLFMYPGGRVPKFIDGLITNFHLPQSTLLMLVCAIAGKDFVMSAYEEAVKEKYRFFSFGDAMLIL